MWKTAGLWAYKQRLKPCPFLESNLQSPFIQSVYYSLHQLSYPNSYVIICSRFHIPEYFTSVTFGPWLVGPSFFWWTVTWCLDVVLLWLCSNLRPLQFWSSIYCLTFPSPLLTNAVVVSFLSAGLTVWRFRIPLRQPHCIMYWGPSLVLLAIAK